MAFCDELSETLAELRRAATDRYDEWLRSRSMNDLKISDDGTRVVEHQGVYHAGGEEWISAEQEAYDQFLTEVDALVERFTKYSPLDTRPLSDVRSSLSRYDITALGGDWGVPDYTAERPHKVVDRVDHAATIVLMAAEPRDMQAEDRTWSGAAADAFNDGFLVPFRRFAAKQIFCGVYLANVAKIFFNATLRTQRDLTAIADACIAALRGEGGSLSDTLSDASMFANLLGFVLPSPFDDLIGAGSIALDHAATQVGEHEERPEWSVDGSGSLDPWVAIESTMEVLSDLEEQLADEDARLFSDLTKDTADYFYSADFALRPEEPDPPDRVGEAMAANLHSIYEYGYRYLPTAAAQYAEAEMVLDGCVIPDWFGELLYPSSRMEFIAARNGLRPALVRTTGYLTEAAESLVTICNDYQWEDAVSAAGFEEFKQALPPPQPADYPEPVFALRLPRLPSLF